MLLMLLLLPAGMVAQTRASSSKYIATYDSESATLTFEKYEGESLPSNSKWVEDGKSVFEMFGSFYAKEIKHIVINESFKTFTPTTLSSFFAPLFELETITGLEYLNTENVTDMSLLFDHCQKLTSLDVTHFNTAKVTNMYKMFNACGLTSLDLSNFNTEKVTNMEAMFSVCPKLKTIYASDKFTTAAVTKSEKMFSYCDSLSGDINWTSDKATDKTYAKIDGGYFRDKAYDNCPWVKYADGTLTFRCGYKKTLGENEYALNSGENPPAWNTNPKNISKVVFEASFANARPTSCYAWFRNFKNLTQIEGIENLNTENVTSMSSMFDSCSGLISLDVTNFNTANVTDMSYMFYCCYKLKEIYVSDKFVTDDVISSTYMFMGCNSLSGDIDWTSDKATNKTYAKTAGGYFRDKAYDNRPWVKCADGTLTFRCGYKKTLGKNEYALNSGENQPAWYTHNNNIKLVVFDASFANARPTTCSKWFQNFKNLKQIKGIENLNTENVTSMAKMFSFCQELSELDVTHFNTANVTDMGLLFDNCRGLTSLDVTHFNTANVKNMSHMFFSCSGLTSLDVTHFNTANVTDMNNMFYNSNLAELDLTHFNTANVTDMRNMFAFCQNLTTIYVNDDFVITNKSYDLFSGCTKLKGAIDYGKWKTDYNFANYKTGYFTKLVGKNGDEKIGAAGKTLATENLLLDDNKDFVAYEPFAAKAASYSRTMTENTTWATLCLPFEVSLANQNFRAFKLLSADDAAETVELEEIKTSIEAGTPVIIKMKDGETKLSFSGANKTIANEVKTAETANGNYQLQGLYTQKVFSKAADNNCYIVKGDKLMNPVKLLEKTATESVGSRPFRAYMVDKSSAPVAGARMFSIRIGDGTTAIKQLEADAADTADGKAEYYDLQGHRLQDLQKGVNIVKRGGKTMKVVIK